MSLEITIEDNATSELQRLAKEYPALFQRALKSLGWIAQKEIKAGIKDAAPAGVSYERPIPVSERRIIDKAFKKPQKSKYPLLGRLYRAVGYDKSRIAQGQVTIGWLSQSAVYLGSKVEKGVSYPVTNAMRKRFMIAGMNVKKQIITIPARPTFRPMRIVIDQKATQYLTDKIKAYIANPSLRGAASSRRRYRVYASR